MTMTDTRPETAAGTVNTPDTITIPYSTDTLGGIYAVALHASKDAVTPVIATVKIDARTFIATDRYSVGEWTHTASTADEIDGLTNHPDAVILIPRTAAEWLAKQNPKALGVANIVGRTNDAAFVIDFTAESITIRWSGESGTVLAVTRFAPVTGNFPPLARLFPNPDEPSKGPHDGPLSLNPAFLERFTKGAARAGERNAPLRMTTRGTDMPSRPAPILFTFADRFRGLLMPNLLLR